MEINSLITDIILILSIIIPLAYLVIYTTGLDKKVKREVIKLCIANNLTLDNFEINGDLILGLDSVKKKLIQSSRKQIEKDFQIIDLPSIKECRVKTIKHSRKTIDWIGLELISSDAKKDIAFYMEDDENSPGKDPQMSLQKAKNWEKFIIPLLIAS
jgi:hypothetical protein